MFGLPNEYESLLSRPVSVKPSFEMRILALNQYYLPAYKAGGAVRTIANMVERMDAEFRFRIIAKDRDFGDSAAFPSVVRSGEWQTVGKADVCYLAPGDVSFNALRRLLCADSYDVLYLNSFFAFWFTVVPLIMRRLGLIPRRPVVVAPRGEFSPGALALKRTKKLGFILFARLVGLYQEVLWQASSDLELEDIRRWFGAKAQVHVAPDIPELVAVGEVGGRREKLSGQLRVVFLSRIAEKKNILGALDLLRPIRGEIEFDIFGIITEPAYWEKCCEAIAEMPANVRVRYMGSVPNHMVREVFGAYDVFLFPTLGENFGHVILEALSAGCPVAISDQTPWRGLEERGVGWDVSLSDRSKFVGVLQCLADMDEAEHARWRARSARFGIEYMDARDTIAANEALFRRAVANQEGANQDNSEPVSRNAVCR